MSEEFNLICRDTSNSDYHHSNRLSCSMLSGWVKVPPGKCVPHGRHCISDTQLLIVVCQADSEKLNFRLEQCYADSTATGQQELYKHECNALDRPLWCHKGPQYLSYCLGGKPTIPALFTPCQCITDPHALFTQQVTLLLRTGSMEIVCLASFPALPLSLGMWLRFDHATNRYTGMV